MTEIFISVATWILWLHVTINMSSDPAWMPMSFVDTCPIYKGKLRKTNWCLIPLKINKNQKHSKREKKSMILSQFYFDSSLFLSLLFWEIYLCYECSQSSFIIFTGNPCLKYITVYVYPFLLLMSCFQFCVISIVML